MTRVVPFARFWPLVAALLAVVAALLVADGVPAARAQDDTSAALWSATFTPVSIYGGSSVGCANSSQCGAQLTDSEFTVGGETYSFNIVSYSEGTQALQVILSTGINAELAKFEFCIGTERLPLRVAHGRYVFNGFLEVGWSANVPVSLSIRKNCSPLSLSISGQSSHQIDEGETVTIVGKLNHGPVNAPTNYYGFALGLGVLDIRVDKPAPPEGQIQTFIQPGQDTFRLLAHIVDDDIPEFHNETVRIQVGVDLDQDGSFETTQIISIAISNNDGDGIAVTADNDAPTEGDRVTLTFSAVDPTIIRPLKCLEESNNPDREECEIPEGYGWWVKVTFSGTASLSSTWPPRDEESWDYYAYNGRGYLTGDSDLYFLFTPDDHTHTLTVVIREDGVDDDGEIIRIHANGANNVGYSGGMDFTIRDAAANSSGSEQGDDSRERSRQGDDPGGVLPTAVELSLDPARVGESAGAVTLTATLDRPAPADGNGINLRLYAGGGSTAVRGADYTMPGAFRIAAGERSGTAAIAIIDDSAEEDDETVEVSVYDATLDAVLSDSAVLTIIDDDTAAVPERTPRAAGSGPAPAQQPANQAPVVANAIADAAIAHESGTLEVSLAGVFRDADDDPLAITVRSSDSAVAAASVSADHSTLTVSARSRGTAAITVTAADGNGNTASNGFTVTVKTAPTVASPIADLSLAVASLRQINLSGVFADADGDTLTYAAESSDDAAVTVYVVAAELSLFTGFDPGRATVTVTAEDADGNRVTDTFDVSAVQAQQAQQERQAPDPPEQDQAQQERQAPDPPEQDQAQQERQAPDPPEQDQAPRDQPEQREPGGPAPVLGDLAVTVNAAPGEPAPVWRPALAAVPGDGEIRLTWTQPDSDHTGYGNHTGYQVQYKAAAVPSRPATGGDPATGWTNAAHQGLGRTATISGLDNSTPYDVRVRAVRTFNAVPVRYSAWSNTAQATPTTTSQP